MAAISSRHIPDHSHSVRLRCVAKAIGIMVECMRRSVFIPRQCACTFSERQAVGDEKYGDQNTDGSYSLRMFFTPLRKAGATVRLMLEQAAANEWKVDVSECKSQNHDSPTNEAASPTFPYSERNR